ncbi:MAG TPA: 2-oxoglutarate oxidoreductase [Armatimonadetes bacterium]|nr:2-oxoglutarate oxidoreductase [Armatimonadota bacterium]
MGGWGELSPRWRRWKRRLSGSGERSSEVKRVFGRPRSLTDVDFTYCPGCTHGIIHRLIAEAMDELGIRGRTVGVCPVGCAVFAYEFFNCDMIEAAHGRAPAVATGIKRVRPDLVVFTYQGDGDLASIGMAEIIHAAARGEKITVFFVNNAVYGMTGGQMAPTTLLGQKTTTSPFGRSPEREGYPIRMCELLATLEGAVYLARAAPLDPKGVIEAGRFVRRAFQCQLEGLGFSMVEFVSTCPVRWGMGPMEAIKWAKEKMLPQYPVGEIKVPEGEG